MFHRSEIRDRVRAHLVETLAIRPNTGYAFAVGRISWHGREKIPGDADVRNSLMNIYYRDAERRYPHRHEQREQREHRPRNTHEGFEVSEYVGVASSGPSAAFFDLDRTLISGSYSRSGCV